MKVFFTGIVCIALAGCVTTGKEVKPDQMGAFKKGATTAEQVVAALGKPTTDIASSDGSRTIVYGFAATTVRPETLIPFIGPFVGGADSRSGAVLFRFNKAGKLEEYQSTQSQASSNMLGGVK